MAAKRPDNVSPAFRGIIVTDDGAKIYFEFNRIALLRPEDKARVFTTSLSLRTGDPLVRAFACENELASAPV